MNGIQTAFARSIFAAENSDLVSPHYRFIITSTINKNKTPTFTENVKSYDEFINK